jgi:MFS family permease
MTTTGSSGEADFPLFKWRFLLLVSFSSFTFIQSWAWLGFAAFSSQSQAFFGWQTDAWINWYLFVGPVAFIVATPLFTYLLDRRGLRLTCVLGSGLVLAGAVLRTLCLWVPVSWGWPLALVGQALVSIAGVAAQAVPPKLSSIWFGPKERSVSTSIAVVCNSLGTAFGFLVGLAYQGPGSTPMQCLQFQLLLQLAFAAVSFLSIVITVRDGPPTPSSHATDRDVTSMPLLRELSRMICNGQFVFLVVVAGLSQGIFTAYSGMLGLILKDGFSPTTTDFLGFGSNVAGVAGGLVMGVVAVFFRRRYRALIVVCFLFAGANFAFFTVCVERLLPFNVYAVSVLCLVGSFFIAAANPLFYELGVELAYPAPEGLVGVAVSLSVNFFGSPFYPIQAYIPTAAVNWINAGSALLFGVLMIFMRETYRRNNVEVAPVTESLASIGAGENDKLIQ